jgi:hypothetical protein
MPVKHQSAINQLERLLSSRKPQPEILDLSLRVLAKWRSFVLSAEIKRVTNERVHAGPFRGMTFDRIPSEGCFAPRLLGSYERELHPYIEQIIATSPEVVLDIGCAEGYYAVGFARRLPDAKVYAYDTDPAARAACARLASVNGVSLEIGETFAGKDFERFSGKKTLVFCDIEGSESDLLEPVLFPSLRSCSLIVECHRRSGISHRDMASLIADRFRSSHEVIKLDQAIGPADLPEWCKDLGHLDLMLALWEWRYRPTPWLVMLPRTARRDQPE